MTDLAKERLLYIPNERTIGDQEGPRRTFQSLWERGKLLEYEAYSLHVKQRETSLERALQDLIHLAERLQPTLVLWQHPGHLDIPTEVLERLRRLAYLIYHEGDIYGNLKKRLPLGARRLAEASDVAFTVGMGSQANILRRFGAKSLGYIPSCVDLVRFGKDWEPTTDRSFDVIMIGNRIPSRIPGMAGIPGAQRREKLAKALGVLLGSHLGLYGHGWEGFVGARGPIPFAEQERVSRNAWLTAGWDHFDRVPYYFSNRLPISLASGVAHITNRQPGYDHLFEDGVELYMASSVREMVQRIEHLLSGSREQLDQLATRADTMARRFFAVEVVFEELLMMSVRHRDGGSLPPPAGWITQVR